MLEIYLLIFIYLKVIVFEKMNSPASTFEEAQEICAKHQGQLAFFWSENEYNDYLREPVTEKEWLGLKSPGTK